MSITGVVKPTVGSVRFAGEDITGLPAHAICQRGLSRTFQLTSLFPEMTARENARLAAQARNARRWLPFGGDSVFARRASAGDAALELLGLEHVASRPAGLSQPRRPAAARGRHGHGAGAHGAAARRADAGPLGRGDGAGRRDTGAVPGQLAVTVLLVEHDMEVVFRLAHKITVLHRGAVIADGHA